MSVRKKLGIIGGGQLALMMIESAKNLNVDTVVLASSDSDPAIRYATQSIVGNWTSDEVVKNFLSQCDLVTFENEFYSLDTLMKYADKTEFIFPNPTLILKLQNKLTQKKIFSQLGLATAAYEIFSGEIGALHGWLEKCIEIFAGRFVLKWSTGGYDGKGVFIVDGINDARSTMTLDFAKTAVSSGITLYAEKKIDFARELALVATRGRTGQWSGYPLVITEQDRGICKRVYGPAILFGIPQLTEQKALAWSKTLLDNLGYVGTLGMELFEDFEGQLWINEVAPRVHNSGHYTQDACPTSQFENHIRAGLGMELGVTLSHSLFAMTNILGPETMTDSTKIPDLAPHMRLHWYDKKELRPRRKMGHINALVEDPADLGKTFKDMEIFADAICQNQSR